MTTKKSYLDKLTVGAEIECGITRERVTIVDEKLFSFADIGKRGTLWRRGTDGSIGGFSDGHMGVEYRAPIMGSDNAAQHMYDVISFMRDNDVEANATCGAHVHVGVMPIFKKMSIAEKFTFLGTLYQNVANLEPAIFFYSGGLKRMRGEYAKNVGAQLKDIEGVSNLYPLMSNKYWSINVGSLDRLGTVEYRIFEGTMSPEIWRANVTIALGITDASLRGEVLPELPHSADGLRQLEKLFALGENTLNGQIDYEYLKFRKNARAIAEISKGKTVLPSALEIWRKFLENKQASVKLSANMRKAYLKLRELLPSITEVMTFEQDGQTQYILRVQDDNRPVTLTLSTRIIEYRSNRLGRGWAFDLERNE